MYPIKLVERALQLYNIHKSYRKVGELLLIGKSP